MRICFTSELLLIDRMLFHGSPSNIFNNIANICTILYIETIHIYLLSYTVELTLCCMSSFFRRCLRYSLRWAAIVYRLIDMALIGNFLTIPSYFKIEIFALRTL